MLKLRKPDIVIGDNYLHRWYIIPRNRFFNVYLHKIMKDDDDRALHDHPWWSVSFLIRGRMGERYWFHNKDRERFRWIPFLIPVFRPANGYAHRLIIFDSPVWTIFITGKRVREWGFWCPKGWKHWRDYTTGERGEKIGVGCDDE